ncbi:hypothetical protein OJF2_32500 [Aquisphaera giovannonii]|uniref:Uncharacterized protein n=1 Tax=Aquisphaera giovannonii TaxID=406548 RepID=A0A5B9W2C6_9BACT|nr:hypothetical protein [Aquisphaera giovannonii]QEH34708.1 hypothetical protein OJF2_32500 [Aquisphaera giovannonii]
MGRRPLNRMELRAAAEAAEALGLNKDDDKGRRRSSRSADDPSQMRSKPAASPRMRVVWAVCDMGGRTVATFDYADKADAEAKAADLKARGKGNHFVRSVKEPMEGAGPRY